MKYAVIDLSSTGVSIAVAEGDKATGVFSSIYKDRTNIAVADYFDGKSISRRGIEKMIDALITARSTCKAMGVDECYCISTAALRNVDNIEEIAERVRMRTGIVINYLDGPTEAYCDFVANLKYSAYDSGVLIDIGGGSVELCDFAKKNKDEMICLDFGPMSLRNKYVTDVYPTLEQAKQIKKYVRKKSDEAKLPGKRKFSTAVLVGSINDALYAVYGEYCEKEKLGSEFGYDKFKQFTKWLLTSPDRTRLIMKVAPEKIHVLPVAALVLKELIRRFKPDNVVISDTGVKEGYMSLVATGAEQGVPVDLFDIPSAYEVTESAMRPQRKPGDKKSKKSGKSEKPTDKTKSGDAKQTGKTKSKPKDGVKSSDKPKAKAKAEAKEKIGSKAKPEAEAKPDGEAASGRPENRE